MNGEAALKNTSLSHPPIGRDPVISLDSRLPRFREDGNDSSVFSSFEALVEWVSHQREGMLHAHLIHNTRLVDFNPPTLTLNLNTKAPKDLPHQLAALLKNKRGEAWTIAISPEIGHPTLYEQEQQALENRRKGILETPLVKLLMESFPGTTLIQNEDS